MRYDVEQALCSISVMSTRYPIITFRVAPYRIAYIKTTNPHIICISAHVRLVCRIIVADI